jgi:PHD/YefM family antitoxin component YafN of YafNO toxin-antitoxin module
MSDERPPWEIDRPRYVDDAARRTFALGDLPALTRLPELFVAPCPRDLYVSAGTRGGEHEVHAIGVYESRARDRSTQDRVPWPIRVHLRRTPLPVVLVLMSYDPVAWQLDVDADARLHGVVLSSYYASIVHCPVPVSFVLPIQNGPHHHTLDSTEPREPRGMAVITQVERAVHMSVTSFQGDYAGEQFTVPCSEHMDVVRDVLTRHAELVRERTVPAPAPFVLVDGGFIVRHGTREEPIPVPDPQTKAAVFCADDGRYYAIADHALYAVAPDGSSETLQPPGGNLSWLGGVAWDSKRGRIIVTTCWHSGDHYLYELATRRWEAVPIERTGGGIHAVAYEPGRDVVFALLGGLIDRPLFGVLSPELEPRARLEHSEPVPLPSVLLTGPSMQLVAFPDALLCCPRDVLGHENAWDPGRVERGFLLALDADRTRLVDLRPGSPVEHPHPTASDETAVPVVDVPEYQGSIYTADLRRDTTRIIDQVLTKRSSHLLIHRSHAAAMLSPYDEYEGWRMTLDEVCHPDWSERLARARREIAARDFVSDDDVLPPPSKRGGTEGGPLLIWTRQAAEDFKRLDERDRRIMCLIPDLGTGIWSVPMDGPYRGFRARPSPPRAVVVFQLADDELRIAYVRSRREP